MTSKTETPAPATSHLASLAAALKSADRADLGRVFAEMAEEALELAASSPTREWFHFWGDLHESFHFESQSWLAPPKPKRRWFR